MNDKIEVGLSQHWIHYLFQNSALQMKTAKFKMKLNPMATCKSYACENLKGFLI